MIKTNQFIKRLNEMRKNTIERKVNDNINDDLIYWKHGRYYNQNRICERLKINGKKSIYGLRIRIFKQLKQVHCVNCPLRKKRTNDCFYCFDLKRNVINDLMRYLTRNTCRVDTLSEKH